MERRSTVRWAGRLLPKHRRFAAAPRRRAAREALDARGDVHGAADQEEMQGGIAVNVAIARPSAASSSAAASSATAAPSA